MFKGHSAQSDAPAVVYDLPDDGLKARASYAMGDQVSRTKAAADAQGMTSRRQYTMNSAALEVAPLHKFPASHVVYDTTAQDRLRYPRTDVCLSFQRTTSRDQRPTEVQKPRLLTDPVATVEVPASERTVGKKVPTVTFDKLTDRPQFLSRVPHDLEYDGNGEAKMRKIPAADLMRTKGHESLFVPTITSNCDYAPDLNAIKPRTSAGPTLDKVISRDRAKAGIRPPEPLDHFYQTDAKMRVKVQGQDESVPLTGPRVRGNPMLQKHMTREKRAQILTQRKVSPDKFYDFDLAKVRPNPDRQGVPFKKNVGRDEASCGRMMTSSPRAEAQNVRSPGFIYDPKLEATKPHVASATFGVSTTR